MALGETIVTLLLQFCYNFVTLSFVCVCVCVCLDSHEDGTLALGHTLL
jgi:hypothetical protein